MASYSYTFNDSWNYYNFHQTVKKNKNSGAEVLMSTGEYVHEESGIIRIGERINPLNETEDLIERTVAVFNFSLDRLSVNEFPNSAFFINYVSNGVANIGEPRIHARIRPWAGTELSYLGIVNNYVPYDMTSEEYTSQISEYEKTVEVSQSTPEIYYSDIKSIFYKFMRSNSNGFMLTATRGFLDLFSPGYLSTSLRPQIKVTQVVAYVLKTNAYLDAQVVAAAKVKGVCRDRDGIIISGVNCNVIAFSLIDLKILGFGISSLDGSFLIDVNCKAGETVVVGFAEESNVFSGAEIMVTVSSRTTS